MLREWMQAPIRFEVRVFVVNRKMTAASQYYVPLYVAELIEKKSEIKSLLVELFESIRTLCPIADYSMDVAIDLDKKRALVIELNPFGPPDGMGTGTVLFSNRDPEDLAILFGERPFEFRVQEEPIEVPLDQLLSGELKTWFFETIETIKS